jgi:hypothetical protein
MALKCEIAICYTIQQKNVDDVKNMVDWVRSLCLPKGERCLSLKFAHGRDPRGDFLCTEDQIRKLYDDVFSDPELKNTPAVEYLVWFKEHQSSIGDIVAGRPTHGLYSQQGTRCFTPHLFSLIDTHGDVYPCCFLFEDNDDYSKGAERLRQNHRIGRLETNRFAEIWGGSEYDSVRQELGMIEPAGKYNSCATCTRHCNHNVWLTRLYAEYEGLRAAGGNADALMESLSAEQHKPVWL